MKTDADDIRDEFGERLWKTPDELMPMNVRPEFIEAAGNFLTKWEPSHNWKDTCLCLIAAAFGQKVFDGDIDVGSQQQRDEPEYPESWNVKKGMPTNVRPEFMEAVEKLLNAIDETTATPTVNDLATTVSVVLDTIVEMDCDHSWTCSKGCRTNFEDVEPANARLRIARLNLWGKVLESFLSVEQRAEARMNFERDWKEQRL